MKKPTADKILISTNVLRLIVNLEKQLDEQKQRLDEIEGKIIQIEKNLRILVKELIHAGCVNVPERRKMLKRSVIGQEALINLLKKKGIINRREFLREIRQLVQREKTQRNE